MFAAKLLIDDKEVEVLSCSFSVKQSTDARNRPIANPLFMGLQVVITARRDLNLAQWALSPIETRQLELHMYPILMGGKTKKFYFYDCQLVDWSSSFDATGSQTLHETLHITAEGVKNADVTTEYSTFFRKTFRTTTPITTIEEEEENNEPRLLGYYFEDENNQRISQSNIRHNQKVTLVLQTEHANGKTIKVDLNDPEIDYIYQGAVLKNDTLTGVKASGKETRVFLIAVRQ